MPYPQRSKGVRAWTWRQKLVQRPWRGAASSIEPMTTSPGVALSTVCWALPHKLLIKKMTYRLAHSNLMGSVFQFRVLFPENSSFCQVDRRQLNSTDIWSLNQYIAGSCGSLFESHSTVFSCMCSSSSAQKWDPCLPQYLPCTSFCFFRSHHLHGCGMIPFSVMLSSVHALSTITGVFYLRRVVWILRWDLYCPDWSCISQL